MTPYIIIATISTPVEKGIHSFVLHHAIKTSFSDAFHWVELVCKTMEYTDLTLHYQFNNLTSYKANVTCEQGNGSIEFDIWEEDEINL